MNVELNSNQLKKQCIVYLILLLDKTAKIQRKLTESLQKCVKYSDQLVYVAYNMRDLKTSFRRPKRYKTVPLFDTVFPNIIFHNLMGLSILDLQEVLFVDQNYSLNHYLSLQ